MQMLKGIGASVKRGRQQVLQKVGVRDETKDEEYEAARSQVAVCRSVFREVDKLLRQLSQNISDLSGTFQALSVCFGSFRKAFKAEQVEGISTDFLATAVEQLTEHAQIFADTVHGNSLQLTKAALDTFDRAEASHAEIRQVQLDMDGLRHEVVALTASAHDAKQPLERKERNRELLTKRTGDLERVAERHCQLLRDAKKDLLLASADASASLWSIYSIIFRQTSQHFRDMSKETDSLLQALARAKQGQGATASRAAAAGELSAQPSDGIQSLCERARAVAAHTCVGPPSNILPLEGFGRAPAEQPPQQCTAEDLFPAPAAPPAAAGQQQPQMVFRTPASPPPAQPPNDSLVQWSDDPFDSPRHAPERRTAPPARQPPAQRRDLASPADLQSGAATAGTATPQRSLVASPVAATSSGSSLRSPLPSRPPPGRPPPAAPAPPQQLQQVPVGDLFSTAPGDFPAAPATGSFSSGSFPAAETRPPAAETRPAPPPAAPPPAWGAPAAPVPPPAAAAGSGGIGRLDDDEDDFDPKPGSAGDWEPDWARPAAAKAPPSASPPAAQQSQPQAGAAGGAWDPFT
eukprot:TRINITY_DN23729_c0_g1_i1.p1 TRINITY_DN23729_c0_g1~~TRINITY_DN23729_c0_g1_i1.p1  ORF type:complete len:608 (+),score=205.03 TRINITY_DN23729_c0_g1_i1:95-1825(+)